MNGLGKEAKRAINMLAGLEDKIKRIDEMRVSREGKFTVIGVDMFDGSDWIQGRYTAAEEALTVAKKQRKEALKRASGPEIADRY